MFHITVSKHPFKNGPLVLFIKNSLKLVMVLGVVSNPCCYVMPTEGVSLMDVPKFMMNSISYAIGNMPKNAYMPHMQGV